MVGRLHKGEIDGFCAGEPWTRRTSASRLGRLVATSLAVYAGLGEKVLGVRNEWHASNTKTHAKLVQALKIVQFWLENRNNRAEAVEIIASKQYVNTPKNVVEGALHDALDLEFLQANILLSRFIDADPNIPNRSHMQWYVEQMQKYGHSPRIPALRFNFSNHCLEKFYRESIESLVANNEHRLPMDKQLYG